MDYEQREYWKKIPLDEQYDDCDMWCEKHSNDWSTVCFEHDYMCPNCAEEMDAENIQLKRMQKAGEAKIARLIKEIVRLKNELRMA